MNSQSTDELMSQWFSPATSWQKMASTMLPMQQSLGQMPGIGTSAFNMGDAIDPLGKLLTAPGIGYFREPQEKLQKGIQLALEYQQSNAKYNMAFVRVSVESIQKFQQLLQNQATGQDSEGMPSSLRDLYDQWIIVSEEHHADFAMSEEYQAIYGDMVNRLMALKKHYNEMLDDMMKNMNLPTRSETDSMQLRLQQLKRENFSLHSEIREIKAMLVKDKKSPAPKAAIKKSAAVKKVSTRSKPKSKAGA